MKLASIQKREIIKRIIFIAICITIGWYLKARFTPQMPAMMGGMGGDPYVLTTKIQEQDVSAYKEYIGTVEPIKAVDLRPQITGYVKKVMFEEGSIVKEGEVLFIIEQERYYATLDLRDAELKKAQASLTRIEKDYKRQEALNKQRFASESQLDTAYSDLLQAQASVKQARANLELAKIDLNYTEIKAPFTGQIGKALVTEGNFVSSSNQVLARIVQINPVRVAFSLSDKDFIDLRKKFQTAESKIRTNLILPNGEVLETPVLSHFTDNEVNTDTATVAVYTEFDNSKNLLVPGNYVQVLIDNNGNKASKKVVVPQQALAQDNEGNFVYIVNNEGIAEQKRITLGNVVGDKQIVLSGLKIGDQVVIQGLQRISNGKKVNAQLVGE